MAKNQTTKATTATDALTPADELSFAEALHELEAVTTALEDGNVPLEALMALTRRGSELIERCERELTQAEGALEELIATSEGELITRRLDDEDEADEGTTDDDTDF